MSINNKYDINQVENAYRKLKSYIYYDNFFVYLREKIAEFEFNQQKFERDLNELLNYLNNPDKNEEYFNRLLSKIDTIVISKKYKNNKEDEDFVITNSFTDKEYQVEKVNYLIDAPVEIHIISILWILEEGYLLAKDYIKNNYAYCLETDPNNFKVVDGLRLFKPYFEQYQKWRDNAVDKAQHFLKDETDVLIIGLDIKEYFYNISFNEQMFRKVSEKIIERKKIANEELFFTKKIYQINQVYSKKLPKNRKEHSIPIGLLSSGILSNWYLKDLDNQIIDNLSPAYYGRYVDDIVIVLANAKIPEKEGKYANLTSIDRTFEKFFTERNVLKKISVQPIVKNDKEEKNQCDKNDISYHWIKNEQIKIQKNKISIHSFNSKESKAVLEKFKKNIRKNSSAFWLLPNENQINDDFDESVYELSYTDTINKLRSISEIKLSKYGASIFLAKKIKVSLLSDNQIDEQTTEQILTFFKGRMNLEFISIWEKVLTYFLITNDHKSFCSFINETINCIDKISFENKTEELKIKQSQFIFLINSIALAVSLNSNFIYNDYTTEKIKSIKTGWFGSDIFDEIIIKVKNYKKTNLFRHNYVIQPLLNYTANDFKKTDFTKYNLNNYKNNILDISKLKYSPRYVYFYEFTHFYSFDKIVNLSDEIRKKENGYEAKVNSFFLEKDDGTDYVVNKVLDYSFDNFFETNYYLRNPQKYSDNPKDENYRDIQLDKLKRNYFENTKEYVRSQGIIYDYTKVSDKFFKEKIRIAVANIKVEEDNIKSSFINKPNTSKERRKELISILNEAEKNKSDFLILPEISVPHRWLPLLADESRRKERAIICGLEHITLDNICYNFSVTILPVDNGGIKDCVIVLRLKNHYAPHEELLIKNRSKIVPKPSPYTYNKFIWNKVHFSVYNCYELADITHRTIFRSEVDLLFASEYNKDVNYFSNIVDTITRDVHCYFIQSNSSDYGDSRITKPSRTETKDILRLKGGTNNVILCGDIDLKQLREFQSTRIAGQNGILFKKTPPDYDHSKAEDRLKGK